MLQLFIPKIMLEIKQFAPGHKCPTPMTNAAKTLLTRPDAVITTPVCSETNVSSKLQIFSTITSQQIPEMFLRKKSEKVMQVGTMQFINLNEYKHFLRVGNHIAHSSPCVRLSDITSDHPLIYEQ